MGWILLLFVVLVGAALEARAKKSEVHKKERVLLQEARLRDLEATARDVVRRHERQLNDDRRLDQAERRLIRRKEQDLLSVERREHQGRMRNTEAQFLLTKKVEREQAVRDGSGKVQRRLRGAAKRAQARQQAETAAATISPSAGTATLAPATTDAVFSMEDSAYMESLIQHYEQEQASTASAAQQPETTAPEAEDSDTTNLTGYIDEEYGFSDLNLGASSDVPPSDLDPDDPDDIDMGDFPLQ